ncbi:MAG TPA: Dabb family protein [Chloroflexota bacterium]|nr:Dabb family protein [Chloroflexota bacterium]
MIKHLVLFKRKPDYDKAVFEEMLAGFRSIQDKIPSVRNMSVGEDFSHRGSFDVALCCEFESEEDLRAYGQHAEHQRLIHDVMSKVVEDKREVVDYRY